MSDTVASPVSTPEPTAPEDAFAVLARLQRVCRAISLGGTPGSEKEAAENVTTYLAALSRVIA